ncbi:MAG: translation initiation factor IF-5A [Nanoarchaeota archaeon]|nr:translation initiation factor IF-5A [Nanoarchaeota archaeon]
MDIKIVGVNELKKGDTVLIDKQSISKITDITFSAPGKHGHAKYRIEAVDVLDGKKRVLILTSEDRMEVPIIEKRNAQVISINGDRVQLMDLESYDVFETDIPEEFKDKLKEGSQVVYSDLMGKKVIKSMR